MDLFDDPDSYEDLTVPLGTDLSWGFSLQPWDATGATTTATFIVGLSSFAMTVSMTNDGFTTTTLYQVHLTPTQLAALDLNVSGAQATYVVHWVDTLGATWQLGNGTILAV